MVIAPVLLLLLPFALGEQRLAGTVVDSSGAPVAGASIRVVAAGRTIAETVSARDGSFELQGMPPDNLSLVVVAPGFLEDTRQITGTAESPLRLELRPRGIAESVTVSARLDDLRVMTPASATILEGEALARAPAWALDDQLRTVPGFSLFRRSSSRVANPTAQGVTLRGLASSGASRTVVLADGFPLNDPFGGWVYWDRIPAASIDRVEVIRGGSSDLYGSDALGGAIRIDSAERAGARALMDAGSDRTARGSIYGGRSLGNWPVFAAAEWFTTDGFVVAAPESRGAIDVRAHSRHTTAYGGATAPLTPASRLSLRASYFTEDRGNGTPFQTNATIVRQISASASGAAWSGAWHARAFGASQDYDQTFSAVAADRLSERPTAIQHVDSGSSGAWLEWLRGGRRSAWLVSGSLRQVDSDLFEVPALVASPPVTQTLARHRTGALVLQGSFVPAYRITVAGGIRGDAWQSRLRDGQPGRTEVGLFPRASLAWRASETVTLRGAVHNAYRSPTINELYRPFRVGNVLTQANPILQPEETLGAEGSVLLRRGLRAVRITAFWTRLDEAIVNVTLVSSPALILRERQNAGRIRAAGVEIETDVRVGRGWSASAAAAYTASTFTEGEGLRGLWVPQVPRWQASAGLQGVWSRATATLDWRFIGRQFDDDRNQFPLDPSSMLNGRVGWRVRRSFEVFGAIENMLDVEQDVGRTPLRTIGLPRTSRVGLRLGTW